VPSTAEPRIGCFGKLPIAGDFIRGDAAVPELAAFDAWIEPGLYRSQQRLGAGFQERWDALPTVRFLWRSGPGAPLLTGWLSASRDAAGRRYPFVVAAAVPAATPAALTPGWLQPFVAGAKSLLDGTWRGLDPVGVAAAVAALPRSGDPEAAAQQLARERSVTDVATAWEGLTASPELLVDELAELAAANPAPNYGLRWPTRGGELETAFWLDALAHFGVSGAMLLVWQTATATVAGGARLVLGRLDPRTFHGMVFPTLDDDDAYDLGRFVDGNRVATAQRRFGGAVKAGSHAAALAALRQGAR
jgi:type VI secretion system ImpM family protein